MLVEPDNELPDEDFKRLDTFTSDRLALSKIEQLRKEFLAEDSTEDFFFTLHQFEPVVAYTISEVSNSLKAEIAKANGK